MNNNQNAWYHNFKIISSFWPKCGCSSLSQESLLLRKYDLERLSPFANPTWLAKYLGVIFILICPTSFASDCSIVIVCQPPPHLCSWCALLCTDVQCAWLKHCAEKQVCTSPFVIHIIFWLLGYGYVTIPLYATLGNANIISSSGICSSIYALSSCLSSCCFLCLGSIFSAAICPACCVPVWLSCCYDRQTETAGQWKVMEPRT